MDHESPELIEKQMEETRTSLTDKVAALEQQVVGTIQNAQEAVHDIVETVRTAVPETITSVKDTLTESVAEVSDRVKTMFDFSQHTREHPWAMVGGAAALGFVAGALLGGRRSGPDFDDLSESSVRPAAAPMAARPAAPRRPSWVDALLDRIGDELKVLGEQAIAAASSSLKQTLHDQVPKLIGPEAFAGRENEGSAPGSYPRPTSGPRM